MLLGDGRLHELDTAIDSFKFHDKVLSTSANQGKKGHSAQAKHWHLDVQKYNRGMKVVECNIVE